MEKQLENHDIRKRLLEEKRHNEILRQLQAVTESLSKETGNQDLIAALIESNKKLVLDLVNAIDNMPKPEQPEVLVSIDNKQLVTLLQEICSDIISSNEQVIEAIKARPLVDEFEIDRDAFGNLATVKVIYK